MNPDITAFLREIASPDPQIRLTAWRSARLVGTEAIVPLGDLAAKGDPGVTKAALGALHEIVHHAARPGAADEAARAAARLFDLAASDRPRAVRAEAVHLLGFVARPTDAAALASLFNDPAIGSDARMARERIASGV